MNCPKSNQNINKKPKSKDVNIDFIWKQVSKNPNLFCWIPQPKDKIEDIKIEDLNLQDIPSVIIEDDLEDVVENISKQANDNKKKGLLKKSELYHLEDDIVSVDNPKKYLIVKEFIKEKGLKIYGGTAVNYYLPKEQKFYTDKDTPDYDFFSPEPWKHAVELADMFYNFGYKIVEAKAGIHKGTYKVFVNLWPVADITFMPKKEFENLETNTIDNIKIVSPFKLLEAFYKEFSEPFGNASRWSKVVYREKLLQKWVSPLSQKFKCSENLFTIKGEELNKTVIKLLEKSYQFIIKNKLLLSGAFVYNIYIQLGNGHKRVNVNNYSVLCENAKKLCENLFDILIKSYYHLDIITTYYPARELNNTVYEIIANINNKKQTICQFTELTNCTPYKYIGNKYIVSIDYLKYELYDKSVFSYNENERNDAKCMIQYLTKIQSKYYKKNGLRETDISHFQRLVTKCKGPYRENNKVEILKKLKENIDRNKKIITKYTKDYKIKMIPYEKNNKCISKSIDDCSYPCFWEKTYQKCFETPKGTYRPGDDNSELYQ